LPANTLSGGYEVANSLRFNDGSSDSLNRENTSSGSRKVFTFSCWFKKSTLGSASDDQMIFSSYDGSNGIFIQIDSNDLLQIYSKVGGTVKLNVRSQMVFRDTSAWYHLVVKFDSNNTNLDLYVNGEEISQTVVESFVDADHEINESGGTHYIGTKPSDRLWDGYMAEVCFIDGTALDETSFGEFDEDSPTIWKPKDVSGLTFGTNGFYLEFKQSGTSQNSSGLGADTSGNDNHFAVNNLTAIDQSTDTCTNNFATLNPLNQISSVAYSEGNLKFTNSSGTNRLAFANFVMTQGKWYCEMKITEHNTNYTHIGLRNIGSYTLTNAYVNQPTNEKVSYLNGGGTSSAGRVFIHGGTETDNMPSYTSGDIIGMACDMDNGYLYYHKNGTYINSGNPASGGSGSGGFDIYNHGNVDYCFAVSNSDGGTDPVIDANFGSPSFAISSGNADGDGYGNFEYAVPSGYYSLNSKNLAEYG
jgi:hypothetical protein